MVGNTRNLKIINEFHINLLHRNKVYSFINLASFSQYINDESSDRNNYFCDGIMMCLVIGFLTKSRVNRVSFDNTSLAPLVLEHAYKHNLSVYIVGAKQIELDLFISKLPEKYQSIIKGSRNGFFDEVEKLEIIEDIKKKNTDILVVGLGAGKQEAFLNLAIDNGFSGVGFSCGGFIRQEAGSAEDYYPRVINKLNLRAFYRMYKEPHTLKRYIIDYPKNLYKIFTLRKLKINILDNDL